MYIIHIYRVVRTAAKRRKNKEKTWFWFIFLLDFNGLCHKLITNIYRILWLRRYLYH